jgi:NAD(P)-dependent dehydrogenase (short-subunit alcohol dehydrogenase family)
VSCSDHLVPHVYPKLIVISTHFAVTGANRGLGLEFVKQYSQDSNVTVLAYQRSDDRSAIEALKKDNVKIIKLDAADDEQVKVSVGSGEMQQSSVRRNRAGTWDMSFTI